jgi:hypothetical protein
MELLPSDFPPLMAGKNVKMLISYGCPESVRLKLKGQIFFAKTRSAEIYLEKTEE